MSIDNSKSLLQLQVIWKDDDMFELRVMATNGRYSGTTEIYELSESLVNFAESLVDFPNDREVLIHEAGQQDSCGYFRMKFFCIDHSGHVGVEIYIEEKVSNQQRPQEKSKLSLEIIVQPSAIDNFQKELLQLANIEEGIALLRGSND